MSIRLLHLNCLYAHDEGYAHGTYPPPWPTPWSTRCATLRRWIAHLDPDIITLNEVTKGRRADGAAVDMLADIVEGSALVHSVFGPACDEAMPFVSAGQYQGVNLGNAIASRWPIARHMVSPPLSWVSAAGIGRGFSSKRTALWASIATPTGPLDCVCTHPTAQGGAHRCSGSSRMQTDSSKWRR
jgi:endonuclease/exonuclease/phosphatase family metal-dependent hydrolase